mmetsp:Transcript_6705/g.10555  ORF Transcript_6705/g.10555 Transcript_6705/m.10555 type:complete len:203 (-) Transcript_6705:329-937(-)
MDVETIVPNKNHDEKKKEINLSGNLVKKELVNRDANSKENNSTNRVDVIVTSSEEDMKCEVNNNGASDNKDDSKKGDDNDEEVVVVAMDESANATTTTTTTTADEDQRDKRISTNRMLDLVFDSLVEVVCLDVCFDAHKRHYLNKFIKYRPRTDIYGNYPKNISEHFKCHHCQRPVTSVKFAPHLEKCMGKTRSRTKRASDR